MRAPFRTMRADGTRPRPADCPRTVHGGIGPRLCPHRDTCNMHVLHDVGGLRGPQNTRALRVLLGIGNDCTWDVIDQHPDGMPQDVLALYLGLSERRTQNVLSKIAAKVASGNDDLDDDDRNVRVETPIASARKR